MGPPIRSMALGCAAFAASAATGQNDDGSVAVEADALIEKVWAAHLRQCGSSAFEMIGSRVILELDQPRFHLAPTRLQQAARQHGYGYQATAIVSARRWRWAPLADDAKLAWSSWQEGQTMTVRFDQTGGERGQTTVPGAVLQFDLIRRHGKWMANRPLSPLNSDYAALDPTAVVPVSGMPSCEQLTRPSGTEAN